MNYIAQLTAAIDKLSRDDTLNPSHVSLYIALFYQWNINRFKNPISVCRTDTMLVSKIGSKSTYHKCIRDLHSKNFLTYEPSHNPLKGSLIHMTIFETSTKTSTESTFRQVASQLVEQAQVPSINNTNRVNKLNNKKSAFHPPTLEEVKLFFLGDAEGEKFYDHFESNGWLVGGKAQMKNWQAAARNCLKRSQEYKTTNPLTTSTNKNYAEPL